MDTFQDAGASTQELKPVAYSSLKKRNTESMDIDIAPKTVLDDIPTPLVPIYESSRKYRVSNAPPVIVGGKRTLASEIMSLKEDLEYTTKFNQKYLEMIVKLRRENIELEVDIALCKEDLETCKKEIRTLKAQNDWVKGLFMMKA